MTWADVRAQLVTMLGELSITDPVADAIVHVYEFPPKAAQDFPCFVIVPPDDIEVERTSSAMRTETPVVRCRYMGLDGGDWATAAEIADAFRAAAIAKFDNITLGGTGLLTEQAVGPIELGKYAGRDVLIFETTLTIRHQTPASFT